MSKVAWALVEWFSLPLLPILAGVLFWRKTFREIPIFCSYVMVSTTTAIVRLLAYNGSRKTYFYTYWISNLALALFAFLSTYELFAKRLFPHFYKIRFYRYLFPVVAVVVTIAAALTAVASTRIGLLFIRIDHGIEFLRVTTLCFFVALMSIMGRRWSRHEFGVASGFAVDAAAFLATFAFVTRQGKVVTLINELPAIAYDIACLIWLITFLKPEQSTPPPTPVSPEVLEEARKWEEAAKGSLSRKKDSD